jgi:4-hydroxy-tetrahydrodipicolinate synthase
VTANVAPQNARQFQEATLRGDYPAALEMLDRLMPLHKAIFAEPGVAGTKYCLAKMGLIRMWCARR